MTLFFQDPSIGLALLALPQILRARRVIFYRPYWLSKEWVSPWRRRRAAWLIHWLNPRAKVAEQDPEEAFPLAYENNLASDRYVEDFFRQAAGSASASSLRTLASDPQIERFYKIRLLPWILYQTQFYRTAGHWTDSSRDFRLVPESHDRYGFHRYFLSEQQLRSLVPPAVRIGLRIRNRLGRALKRLFRINLLILAAAPVLFIARTAWQGGFRLRAAPIRADLVMPIIWGFHDDGQRRGVKIGMDDAYLLGGELDFSRVAFFFSDWPFSPKEQRLQQERMARRGIRFFDSNRLPLTPPVLWETVRSGGRLLKLTMGRPAWEAEETRIARVSASLFYHLLRCRLFAARVDYKVLLEEQDYSAAHVVRTIVSEKLGRITVGDHHAAPDGPVGFPVIRYAHIHRYCTWGDAFRKPYGHHWDRMRIIPVGPWKTDFIKAAQHEERLEALDREFRRHCGGRRPLVVLLFPTLEAHNIIPRLQEAIEGLRLLRGLPGDFTVACQFRSMELAQRYRTMGLEEVLRQDPRIVIDLSHFTTYEWMALSDAVIGGGTSSGLIEAAAAGKPVFSFDHRGLAERVLSGYGKDLILRNRQDLVRAVEQIQAGRSMDCRWNELARDFSHFADGECIRRYRQVILDAIRDAGEPKPASKRPVRSRVLERVAG